MKLHQRPGTIFAALALLLSLPVAGAWAQAGGSAAPTKIGVLSVQEAIAATAEGKVAAAQMQAQFGAQQADLENIQKQIQDVASRLNNGSRTLSDDEKARLQRQGEMMQRQLQRKQDDMNDQVTAARADIVDEIGRKMMDVLDHYAKDKGLALVLDSSAQGTPVVYGSMQLDITQDIVHLYDQQYPVKSSSSAPAAAPKPATPAASRPATPPAAAPAK
jgi:outer membrane protein